MDSSVVIAGGGYKGTKREWENTVKITSNIKKQNYFEIQKKKK